MSAVLALDYGDARIGLAITDPDCRYALAHSIVPAKPEGEALRSLLRVISEEGVSRVILGLPLTLDGREGEQARKVRAFSGALSGVCNLPLEFIDERFTSKEGERAAREKGHATPDAEAARLILQTWLDRQ